LRRLSLKEERVVYEAAIDESLREGETIILEREGRPVAALVPIDEYESFRAWREGRRQETAPYDRPDNRTIEEIVADIQRRSPGAQNVREPMASLADLLAHAPRDPSFKLEEWEREWARIEAEIEANDSHLP
jgi:antitoxin (DNA-binding transcriptional repressor) of toxin-antitoxin stability system